MFRITGTTCNCLSAGPVVYVLLFTILCFFVFLYVFVSYTLISRVFVVVYILLLVCMGLFCCCILGGVVVVCFVLFCCLVCFCLGWGGGGMGMFDLPSD